MNLMSFQSSIIGLLLFLFVLTCTQTMLAATPGRTLYVNVNAGDDANSGLSEDKPLMTIQHACNMARPGDTVRVAKGVYYEHVIMKNTGTHEAPITIYAESHERFATLISGADRDIRERRVQWDCVDAALGLYAINFGFEPNRVNAGEIDLFPYPSLETLKRFALADDFPSPEHGFAYDVQAQRLYVRLHASGRYGSTNPNEQTMNVGGPMGVGQRRHLPTGPEHVLIGVLTTEPAYVIIDGFTFQSAGTSAVFTGADHVTVKNCWFIGCPGAVTGRGEFQGGQQKGDHVRVLQCDYSEPDVWQDMADAIDKYGTKEGIRKYYWWSRKYVGLKERCYERGIVINANDDWEVANCYMHDCFEGLSFICFGKGSTNGRVHHNVFGRSIDNHLEFEYEMQNMVVHDNLFVDAMRSISYQAAERTPGPIWFFCNVIINSDRHLELFEKAGMQGGSWNKFPIKHPIPEPGLLMYNNTIISRNAWGDGYQKNMHLFNNMFWLSRCELSQAHAEIDGNVVCFSNPEHADWAAGNRGFVAHAVEQLGLSIQGSFNDWRTLRLSLKSDSPARCVRIDPPVMLNGSVSPDLNSAGAIAPDMIWMPPQVGPAR